jgi:hypothetical protein
MKKVLGIIAIVAVSAFSQIGYGGYILKSTDGSYSQWAAEQALNSMADWYTVRIADSTGVGVVLTKYGSHHNLKAFANLSASVQKIKYVALNTNDTGAIAIPAHSTSGKLPAIKKVISGMVVDSTALYFQYR